MHTFPLSSMCLPRDTTVPTNSATSRSSVAIPINMLFFSSQNSGPVNETFFFCLFSFSWFLGFHRALYDNMEQWHNHITIGHVPTEKFRSVSSSFSFLSKSPLTLSTLFFLLSSSRSVFLGSYLRKKEKKLTF